MEVDYTSKFVIGEKLKHQNLILVAVIGAFGRYGNVTVAHLNAEKSTADGAVYDIPVNTTPTLPPHTAPEGKDWLYAPNTSDGWVLVDDYAGVAVYDIRTAQRIAPPDFGQPMAGYMTLIEPRFKSGMVTYWDDSADEWAMRKDWSGTQVWSTNDPLQSIVLSTSDAGIPDGFTDKQPPSAAYDWVVNKSEWVLNKDKQAVLDAAERKARVPQVVTIRQAKRALLQVELLDDVEGIMASDAVDRATKVDWENATEVKREWVEGAGLMQALGIDDDKLDQLFMLAASL